MSATPPLPLCTVLGVDPGTANVGVFVLRVYPGGRYVYVTSQTLRLGGPLQDRCAVIRQGVGATVGLFLSGGERVGIRVLAMERQTGALLRRLKAGQSSEKAVGTLQVVGLFRGLALEHGMQVVELEPRTSKIQVVGRGGGRASKETVARALRGVVRDCPAALSQHETDAGSVAVGGARRELYPGRAA